MIYSLDEKIVGKWLDGKDLYQKSYYIDDLTRASITVESDASAIDKLIYAEGILLADDFQVPFTTDGGHNYTSYIIIGHTIDSESETDSLNISAGTSALNDFTEAYVTCRYTKKSE